MGTTYKVTVNQTYNFDLNDEDINNFDVVKKDFNSFHVLENNLPFDVEIIQSNFNVKKYTVQVNGNSYEIEISNALDLLIDDLGLEVSSSKKANDIKAPMPGLLVSIEVEVGQEVKEGESMLILEAMKMENTLVSPRDGIIKFISAKKGDKVEKGELLIEME